MEKQTRSKSENAVSKLIVYDEVRRIDSPRINKDDDEVDGVFQGCLLLINSTDLVDV